MNQDIMNQENRQENRAAIAPRHYQIGLFESEEFLDELVDLFLSNLQREGMKTEEILMRLTVKETSEKLRVLPKRLQQAAIALLAKQFLGDGDTSNLVRGDTDG